MNDLIPQYLKVQQDTYWRATEVEYSSHTWKADFELEVEDVYSDCRTPE